MPISSPNRQITVTLPVECWQAIMRFVKSSCEPKGDKWVLWGQEINREIMLSIYHFPQESSAKKSVGYDANQKKIISSDDIDFDQSVDEYDYHNPDFGHWEDVGGEERVWFSYVDDD